MKIPFHNGHVMGVAALTGPFIGVYVPLAFAVLLPAVAMGALAVRYFGEGGWPKPPRMLVAIFAGLFLWCLASVFWTTATGVALTKLPRFLILILSGLVLADVALSLTETERSVFARAIILGFIIAVAFLAYERIADAPLLRFLWRNRNDEILLWVSFNRGVTALVLFAWPAVAVLGHRHIKAAALVWLAVLAVTLFYDSGAAVVGLVAGTIAYVATHFAPRLTITAMAVLLGILALTAPFMTLNIPDLTKLKTEGEVNHISRSSYHRLLVWRFASQRISEHPVRGWGFESARLLPGGEVRLDRSEMAMPLHPHNAVIQIWLELGLPGAVMTGTLMVWVMLAIRRSGVDRMTRSATFAMATSLLTIASLSYGIWQSWWFAVLWLAGLFAMVAWRTSGNHRTGSSESTASPTSRS